jgi:predicted TIM-barrel fold metal-dependent hydrolase
MAHHLLGRHVAVMNPGQENCEPCIGASRREFLKSLGVLGAAGAILPAHKLLAQAVAPGARVVPGRIDVHHHMTPPFYVKALEQERNQRGIVVRPWTPASSVEMMDKAGVATSMLSPVLRVVMDSMSDKNEKARSLTRQNNEYGAQLVKDYPGRFGLLASLPLPDQDGSLSEIEYSLNTLKADGIALWTDYVDKWPGDPAFASVFDELNRRKAVVFFHPARSTCCRNLPGQSGILEFDIDTARAIDSLLLNGTLSRCPDIRFIFSHAGGAFSILAARVNDDFPKKLADRVPHGVDYEVRKLYFDTAHASAPAALDALKDIVPISQILYGSDVPSREYPLTDVGLDAYEGFSIEDWKAINRGNSERLFPRLKK